MTRRLYILHILTTLMVLLLLPASVASQSRTPDTLHRGNSTEPVTLDPHQSEDVSSGNILRDLYEGLVSEDAAGRIIAGAATKWTVNDDATRYHFTLDTDLKWSDGTALTATDFIYSLRRAVTPATAAPMASLLSPVVNAAAILSGEKPPSSLGVESPDKQTLIITLQRPAPWFLQALAHPIAFPVQAAAIESHAKQAFTAGRLVSNGAWALESWSPYEKLVLKRNQHYQRQSERRFNRVIYYPIENNNSELSRYRAGELDWTDTIPPNKLKWLREKLPDDIFISPYLGTYYYGFNLTQPPFRDNPQLRRALSLAIDRHIITEKILGNGESPTQKWLPPSLSGGHSTGDEFVDRAQQLVAARRLYQQAGYGPDKPLRTTLHFNTSEQNKRIAVTIAAMWKKNLGVQTTLINEEWKVFLQHRKNKSETRIYRASWIADYNDPLSFLDMFTSQHAKNDTGYSNPAYDSLLQELENTLDAKQRRQLASRAEQLLLDDQVIIPIYHYVSRHLVKPDITGYQANPLDHHYSRYLYRQ